MVNTFSLFFFLLKAYPCEIHISHCMCIYMYVYTHIGIYVYKILWLETYLN